MNKLIYASLAPLLLAACGSNADTDASTATDDVTATAEQSGNMMPADDNAMATPATAGTEAAPTDAMGYAAKAGASDMFEIESSKAVLTKSTNAGTKKYAQMMIDHHTESTAKVKAAAKTANMTLTPPKLDAMQQKMLDDIKNADAAGVDRIYMDHQRTGHQAALALHQGYAANGDTPAFKKVAGEIVPVVQKHIAELDKMKTM